MLKLNINEDEAAKILKVSHKTVERYAEKFDLKNGQGFDSVRVKGLFDYKKSLNNESLKKLIEELYVIEHEGTHISLLRQCKYKKTKNLEKALDAQEFYNIDRQSYFKIHGMSDEDYFIPCEVLSRLKAKDEHIIKFMKDKNHLIVDTVKYPSGRKNYFIKKQSVIEYMEMLGCAGEFLYRTHEVEKITDIKTKRLDRIAYEKEIGRKLRTGKNTPYLFTSKEIKQLQELDQYLPRYHRDLQRRTR